MEHCQKQQSHMEAPCYTRTTEWITGLSLLKTIHFLLNKFSNHKVVWYVIDTDPEGADTKFGTWVAITSPSSPSRQTNARLITAAHSLCWAYIEWTATDNLMYCIYHVKWSHLSYSTYHHILALWHQGHMRSYHTHKLVQSTFSPPKQEHHQTWECYTKQ